MVDSKTCHLCGETLASFARLKQHIGRVHNHEKYFHCDLCSYSCETNSRLKRHMDAHLGKHVLTYCILGNFSCFFWSSAGFFLN